MIFPFTDFGATGPYIGQMEAVLRPAWPDDHAAIVTFDHYGNAITGLRASAVKSGAPLLCAGHTIAPRVALSWP